MRVINIKLRSRICSTEGFTLIELMITMLISGLIVAAIYSAYTAQQRTYLAQEQIAEMQQNIRAGLMIMTRDIRMAGYDPTSNSGADIVSATRGRFSFSQDLTNTAGTASGGDGKLDGPNENVAFGFSLAADAGIDGEADAGAASLGRNTGGGFQSIAENVGAIEFYYTLEDGTQTTTPGDVDDIRSVTASILARAGKPDRKFTNNMIYTPASGVAFNGGQPYTDNFRRRLLITTVNCRNMGL